MPRQASDSTNQLKAPLGLRFQCRVCGHRHHPNSRTVQGCLLELVIQAAPEARFLLLAQVGKRLNKALRKLTRLGLWTESHDLPWDIIIDKCPTIPPATIAELASSDGAVHYRARYTLWQRKHRAKLARLRTALESLDAQEERLADGKSGRPRQRSQARVKINLLNG